MDDGLSDEVITQLLRFIAGVVLHSGEVSRRVGLGPSDSQFLGLLAMDGPLTPGQLATQTGLTTGTVTGVIDRLERGGFVRRERDAGDRRKVLVVPVPEAVARMSAHYAEHGAHTGAVLARRDAAQLQVIADFLGELNASPGGMVSGGPT